MECASVAADRDSHEARQVDLPEKALVHVLQHVPLRQRLCSCALVCRSWARAANLPPAHIDMVVDPDSPAWQKLQDWLQRHGGSVQSLGLRIDPPVYRGVPWQGPAEWTLPFQLQRLKKLQLSGFTLLLPSYAHPSSSGAAQLSTRGLSINGPIDSTSSTSITATATEAASTCNQATNPLIPLLQGLQELRLRRVSVAEQCMLLLPQATALTSLELSLVYLGYGQGSWSWLLPQLSSLTELTLGCCGGDSTNELRTLSSLNRLERLTMRNVHEAETALVFLPPSLTALLLEETHWECWAHLGFAAPYPVLPCSSTLQVLHASFGDFDPRVLLRLTALRELDLWSVNFLQTSWGSLLLVALLGMQHLQRLSLRNLELASWADVELLPALTVSSALTALHLADYYSLLPQGGVQAMLPDSKQLTGLKVLHLSASLSSQPCVEDRGFACIARCCPALFELHLHGVCTPASWQQLSQLKASLRQLSLTGSCVTDEAAAALAQLTGLTELQVSHSSLTVTGLEQLTALQALRLLSVQAKGPSDAGRHHTSSPPAESFKVELQHCHGCPAVYLQLAAYVEQCRAAQPSTARAAPDAV